MVQTKIVIRNVTIDMTQLCNIGEPSVSVYIDHTDGDKRFQNHYTVIGAARVEHPQHKVEGMEIDVTMGRDIRFEAYVGGWITSKSRNVRGVHLFLDAVHKSLTGDLWAGSPLLTKITGLPIYLANGLYDLSEVCQQGNGVASTPAVIARGMDGNLDLGLNPGVTVGLVIAVVIVLILVAVAVAVVLRLRLGKPSSAPDQPSVRAQPSNDSAPGAQPDNMSTKELSEELQGQQNV